MPFDLKVCIAGFTFIYHSAIDNKCRIHVFISFRFAVIAKDTKASKPENVRGKQSFRKVKVNRQLLNALADLGFSTPTEIQEKVIPSAQAGHDLLGIAQTGTGKTFAFLIPLIMKLKYHQAPGPRALILAPTRELVLQIAEAFSSISIYYDLKMVCLYGGIGPKTQLEELEKVQILSLVQQVDF